MRPLLLDCIEGCPHAIGEGASSTGQDEAVAATPAVDVLVRSGTAYRLHEYTHDPAAPTAGRQRRRSGQSQRES